MRFFINDCKSHLNFLKDDDKKTAHIFYFDDDSKA